MNLSLHISKVVWITALETEIKPWWMLLDAGVSFVQVEYRWLTVWIIAERCPIAENFFFLKSVTCFLALPIIDVCLNATLYIYPVALLVPVQGKSDFCWKKREWDRRWDDRFYFVSSQVIVFRCSNRIL